MKKYKGLSRVFLLSYVTVAFSGMLFGLLLVKYNPGLFYLGLGLVLLDLAAIIVARVFYSKNFKVFLFTSLGGFAFLNVLVITGFVLEVIFANNGEGAPYAWMVAIAGLVFIALIDLFYALGLRKIDYDKRVASGEIKKEEDLI